jgi:hypothetical protein
MENGALPQFPEAAFNDAVRACTHCSICDSGKRAVAILQVNISPQMSAFLGVCSSCMNMDTQALQSRATEQAGQKIGQFYARAN